MKELLEEIINGWSSATREKFTNHPIAQKIRIEFPNKIRDYISETHPSFIVKSSAGAGNWANVAWLSILNPEITTTTQDGIYPVYLFKADGSGIYLSLILGTTNPAKSLGKKEANKQADNISQYIRESIDGLKNWGDSSIDLAATTALGKSYETSNIVAKYYPSELMPDEEILKKDLMDLLVFYEQVPALWMKIKRDEASDINFSIQLTTQVDNIPLPKPFILLSGISGTGKTRFVKQQAISSRQDASNYQLVPVRPDWHEPSDLLGYISRLGDKGAEYIVTDFLRFIVAAWKDVIESIEVHEISYKDDCVPYWLCLDEMNLAPVEQYFADYLSVIETRYWENGKYSCDPLLNASIFTQVADVSKLRNSLNLEGDENDDLWDYFFKNGISIPPNLIVAGTVNMDETTHGFSRKVIDRAFTLDFGEFFPNDYQHYFEPKTQAKVLSFPVLSQVDPDLMTKVESDKDAQKSIQFLESINAELKGTPFELAYRALNELLIAVVCFEPKDEVSLQAVWDDFLMTKVLPRIEGDGEKLQDDGEHNLFNKLESVLAFQLSQIWESEARPDLLRENINGDVLTIPCRSKKKINWMKNRLSDNGFTSFWP
ncbi:hypothetical protein AU255_00985 [Methyloprofundus sedimenti]|uniref:Type IV methyl-directed restriction enzyme EcoKMcrB subunit DNA-binding domain-containing protein n=1 Tax=Methyloprofundus sedimenti TaxID=1420851 RepID=A0A1V8M532_9GAMM|nr:DUF3578 domain-containing protein [Methyloprofundus sedimenti]OQK16513.1 hypothetical protein AU255_00985 [Methyloprofundus sedimenti]